MQIWTSFSISIHRCRRCWEKDVAAAAEVGVCYFGKIIGLEKSPHCVALSTNCNGFLGNCLKLCRPEIKTWALIDPTGNRDNTPNWSPQSWYHTTNSPARLMFKINIFTAIFQSNHHWPRYMMRSSLYSLSLPAPHTSCCAQTTIFSMFSSKDVPSQICWLIVRKNEISFFPPPLSYIFSLFHHILHPSRLRLPSQAATPDTAATNRLLSILTGSPLSWHGARSVKLTQFSSAAA